MKTVYASNAEIPHLWAHQSQSNARASSVSFDGEYVYSYRTQMGRILKAGVAVMLNCTSYSVSTARHQVCINRSVSHYPHQFTVGDLGRGDCLSQVTGRDVMDWYCGQAADILEKLTRKRVGLEYWRGAAAECIAKANEVNAYFHLHRKPVTQESLAAAVRKLAVQHKAKRAEANAHAKRRGEEATARAIADAEAWIASPSDWTLCGSNLAGHRSFARKAPRDRLPAGLLARLEAAERAYFSAKARTAAEAFLAGGDTVSYRPRNYVPDDLKTTFEAEEAKRAAVWHAKRCEEAEDRAARWLVNPDAEEYWSPNPEYLTPKTMARVAAKQEELNRGRIEAWRKGEGSIRFASNVPTMLRAVGDTVQTNRAASFPLADAERAFRFVIAMRARGWHRNGQQCTIGNYQLDAVNEFGVVAGCHHIAWAEIERFARSQNWIG